MKNENPLNFVLIGVGGYIAPRHLQAIKDTGNNLLAAVDPKDSVGIIDRYFPDASFFTEFERFERHVEKLRRINGNNSVHYTSICSPNYLHDSHIRFGLRAGTNVICEKPLVLRPWNLDALSDIENELNAGKIYTVLQLRTHPSLEKLKQTYEGKKTNNKHNIELIYITPRGKWYQISWKGDEAKSGGVLMNIGIHFIDMLIWIFGKPIYYENHYMDSVKAGGFIELERANVRWFMSTDRNDLPEKNREENKAYRNISVDGEEVEFSEGFTDLHTEVYKRTLSGNGFTLKDIRPALELVYNVNTSKAISNSSRIHPALKKALKNAKR